jgi:hypothetical protein
LERKVEDLRRKKGAKQLYTRNTRLARRLGRSRLSIQFQAKSLVVVLFVYMLLGLLLVWLWSRP